ncbi:MAG: hypothetical protein HC872_09025 [Gammaproteobacteria bacterium]|nr:hypothetical protein [Gammaproteobacteria bacterium]
MTSTFITDDQGSTAGQICGLAPGGYTVEEEMQNGFAQVAVFLNDQPVDGSSVLVTLESADQTVRFINEVAEDQS